jgi:hypothetical protein
MLRRDTLISRVNGQKICGHTTNQAIILKKGAIGAPLWEEAKVQSVALLATARW